MDYCWDETKRAKNIKKHGWDFEDAGDVWDGQAPVVSDYQERKGEDRWVSVGHAKGTLVVIVYRQLTGTRHIISMRSATRKEKMYYEKELARELGLRDDFTNFLDSLINSDDESP